VTGYFGVMSGSLRLIWRFRLRSSLMLLSAMLGVAGVVTAVSYGSAGRLAVLDQLRRLGTNVVNVTPTQSRSVGGRARTGTLVTTLVARDDVEIRRDVPDIVRASAMVTGTFLVKAGDLSKNNCTVIGIEPDYVRIKQWAPAEGRVVEDLDVRRAARVAVLGATVRQDLFGARSPIGQHIFINRVPFEVVGVMTARGPGLDATDEDSHVYVPLSTALHRVMNVAYYSGLIMEVSR
jgi:ABC-type antimicrobial peptide transport system permease subunit